MSANTPAETDTEMLARLLAEAKPLPGGRPGVAFQRCHSDRERRVFTAHLAERFGLEGATMDEVERHRLKWEIVGLVEKAQDMAVAANKAELSLLRAERAATEAKNEVIDAVVRILAQVTVPETPPAGEGG